MKNLKFSYILLALCQYAIISNAQIEVSHNLYTQNLYLLTPAAIGTQGNLYAYANYRNQWTNVPGAPVAFDAGLYSMIHENAGIGVNFVNRQDGVFSTNMLTGNYGQKVKLKSDMSLNFGLSVAAIFRSMDPYKISANNINDPAFLKNLYNDKPKVSVGFGIIYQLNNLNIGFTLPSIYNGIYDKAYSLSNFQGFIGYNYVVNDSKFEIQPLLLLRKNNAATAMISDINASLTWNKFITVRAGFRSYSSDYAYLLGMGFIYHNFGFQYGLEINQGLIKTIAPISQEFGLVFKNEKFRYRTKARFKS
jgi:type IX secretion system PorP/SprF family membrane protein